MVGRAHSSTGHIILLFIILLIIILPTPSARRRSRWRSVYAFVYSMGRNKSNCSVLVFTCGAANLRNGMDE